MLPTQQASLSTACHSFLSAQEPLTSRPHSEDDLQSGFTRRKRAEEVAHRPQEPQDQEAAASSDEEEVEDSEAAASRGPVAAEADDGDMFLEPDAAPGAPASPTEAAATADATGQPQNLFPAFQPLFPLGHSRPPIFQVTYLK